METLKRPEAYSDDGTWDTLTYAQKMFIIEHERLHALVDKIRGQEEAWNTAADQVINELLKQHGIELGDEHDAS